MLKKFDYSENPYPGVYIRACEDRILVPVGLENNDVDTLEEVFRVDVTQTTIGRTNLIGSLIAVNSHGAVVSNIINNAEFQKLTKEMNLTILREKNNAVGNIILTSEDKALISPKLSKNSVRKIRDVLDVETISGTIAGRDNVGMAAVVTTKGLLCHPKITRDEKTRIDEFFGTESSIGTVNFGMPLIGAGMTANSRGAIAGTPTTGVELNRIEHVLDIID